MADARRRASGRTRAVLAAVLLMPVVELVVAVAVGRRLGAGPTLLMLLVISVGGALVLRRQGMGAVALLREAAAAGHPPVPRRDPADSGLLAAGGVLLVLPGFVTGMAGALLCLPPVRRWLRPLIARRAAAAAAATRVRGTVVRGEVVSAEVVDDSQQDVPPDDGEPPVPETGS